MNRAPLTLLLAGLLVVGCTANNQEPSDDYRQGYDIATAALKPNDNNPQPQPGDRCETCDGTGKVGDGRIERDCLDCGGDGIVGADETPTAIPELQPQPDDEIEPATEVPAGKVESVGAT